MRNIRRLVDVDRGGARAGKEGQDVANEKGGEISKKGE